MVLKICAHEMGGLVILTIDGSLPISLRRRMQTEIEDHLSIASLPELDEQYRVWVQTVEQYRLTHERVLRSLRDTETDFWRGFGSVLCIFPKVVLNAKDVINWSIQEALFQNWLSVGRDFLSVCSRIVETSGDSTATALSA